MDKVDTLIKILAEFKEELAKGAKKLKEKLPPPPPPEEHPPVLSEKDALKLVKEELKCSANGQWEIKKADIVRPDAGYGKVTVKDINPKPDPKKPGAYGKVIMKDEQQDNTRVNLNNPYNDQPEEDKKKKLKKSEELEKASKDPALAIKEVKIKELQGKIDAGTYKPDAKKIADKMLKMSPNEATAAAPPVNGAPPPVGSDMAKEDEPHKDDPEHEEKEKVRAKNIKEEAEEILDMHKGCTFAKNGQWNLTKASTPKLKAIYQGKSGNNHNYSINSGSKHIGGVTVTHTPQGQYDHYGNKATHPHHHTMIADYSHPKISNDEGHEAVAAVHKKLFPNHIIE